MKYWTALHQYEILYCYQASDQTIGSERVLVGYHRLDWYEVMDNYQVLWYQYLVITHQLNPIRYLTPGRCLIKIQYLIQVNKCIILLWDSHTQIKLDLILLNWYHWLLIKYLISVRNQINVKELDWYWPAGIGFKRSVSNISMKYQSSMTSDEFQASNHYQLSH